MASSSRRKRDDEQKPTTIAEPAAKKFAADASVAKVNSSEVGEEVLAALTSDQGQGNVWDGTSTSLLHFHGLGHLKKYMLKDDYRGSGSKSDFEPLQWKAFVSTIAKVTISTLDRMIPAGSKVAQSEIGELLRMGNNANTVLSTMYQMLRKSRSNSIERRTICAALAKSLSRRQIINFAKASGVPLPMMNRSGYERSGDDGDQLLIGRTLTKATFRRKVFSEEVTTDALKFLIKDEYIEAFSLGTRKVEIAGEVTEIPILIRKRSKDSMFNDYRAWFREKNGEVANHLPRSTVMEILGLVTVNHKKAFTASNTMLSTLVYDMFTVIERIIKYYTGESSHKQLRTHAVLVSNFLKNIFPKHILLEDPEDKVCTHGLDYALQRPGLGGADKSSMDCGGCKFVHFFFQELRDEVKAAKSEYVSAGEKLDEAHAIKAIDRCESLVDVWRGQCARVANQSAAITSIHAQMEKDCLKHKLTKPQEIVVIMDYNTNNLPKCFAGKQDTIGGTTWHGFLAIYYVYNTNTNKVEREHIFCDQIVPFSNAQDGQAMGALLEVFLMQLLSHEVFVDVKNVTLQSDNAPRYRNKELLLALPFIGMSTGVEIKRYIHSETREGKGLIDGHFAEGMRRVDSKFGDRKNATTSAAEVFEALVSSKRARNTFAQLVEVDHGLLRRRRIEMNSALEGLEKMTRQNEFVFTVTPASPDASFDHADPYSWEGTVQMESWEFSGRNLSVTLVIDPKNKVVSMQAGSIEDLAQIEDDDMTHDDASEDAKMEEPSASIGETSAALGNGTQTGSAIGFGGSVVRFNEIGQLCHESRHILEKRREGERTRLEQFSATKRFGIRLEAEEVNAGGENVKELLALAAVGVSMFGSGEDEDSDVEEVEELIKVELPQGQDPIGYAVREVSHFISGPESLLNVRNGLEEQPEYELAKSFDATKHLTARGYARDTTADVNVKGFNTDLYRKALTEIIQNETDIKPVSVPPSVACILEPLLRREDFKFRLDLPTETDIRGEIKRCTEYNNVSFMGKLDGTSYSSKMKDIEPLREEYSTYIDEQLDLNQEMSSTDFLKMAIQNFSTTAIPLVDPTTQTRVKRIYSSRRRTKRRRAKNPITRRIGKSTANVTGRYRQFIEKEVAENDTKPAECWKRLCVEFNATEKEKPDDFPEKVKAMTFITNWRKKHRVRVK